MSEVKKNYVFGADPGKHGAVVLLSSEYDPMHIRKDDILFFPSKAKEGKLDVSSMWESLYPYRNAIIGGAQEDVHALFGSSAKGTFEFGDATGALRALFQCLAALREGTGIFTLESVSPRVWQHAVWRPEFVVYETTCDKLGRKKKNTKATSSNAARFLFPGVSFVPPRAKKEHDGVVDAALIAYYFLNRLRASKSCR